VKKITFICSACFLICVDMCANAADVPAPVPPARGPALNLAVEAAQAALTACSAQQQLVSVTVLDSAGVIKVVLAADGASARSVASSNGKAQTALAFKNATGQLTVLVKTDNSLAEKIAANSNYNIRAGGLLLTVQGEVIGAIGVGGARGSEKDEACAAAGIAKVQDRLQ